MKLFSYKNRPPQLGPYPLESLARCDRIPEYESTRKPEALTFTESGNPVSLATAMTDYVNLLDRLRDGDVAPDLAPIPDDPAERANHLKAAAYYLDASQAGVCALFEKALLAEPVRNPTLDKKVDMEYSVGASKNAMSSSIAEQGSSAAWQRTENGDAGVAHHTHALVLLVEYTREPNQNEPSEAWLVGTQPQRAAVTRR